ncbi:MULTISPECIES: LolA-related protein [Acidithiobacillus]|jgi:hypothetical protein|uniref:Outer membrane lipoprotein carrier protein LolA n=4 Tax=Acidithiobacillus thiooxidans TaxID=930 RepID=A0A5P9XLI8_ACITH|nr:MULTISPECIES: LolA-related protein [Acidithiobacillus]QFX94812.1 hypothetical protein GCD22_00279 [Acidithiobacillus thiooxidans ATCC 19377]
MAEVFRGLLDIPIKMITIYPESTGRRCQVWLGGFSFPSATRYIRYSAFIIMAFMGLSVMLTSDADAAEWNVNQLMHSLAHAQPDHATFVEKKFLNILEKPIESYGKMQFIAPDGLEMHTIEPKNEVMLIHGDILSIDHHDIHLQDHPELLAFVDSIRGVLTGNQQMLEQYFYLFLKGDEKNWTLTLRPKQKKLAGLIRYIQVDGNNSSITSINTLKMNNDRSLITIISSGTP